MVVLIIVALCVIAIATLQSDNQDVHSSVFFRKE